MRRLAILMAIAASGLVACGDQSLPLKIDDRRKDGKLARLIEVVEYSAEWPALFSQEAERIRSVFGASLVAVHHVGSTSIPGLAAKSVIDILVEVISGTDVPEYYEQMAGLGYDCRGECLEAEVPGTPGRYYFSQNRDGVRYAHVHVCASGHEQILEILAFRDYLREHPLEAKRYGDLKGILAGQFTHNNIEYMRGKDGLVKELIRSAKEWRARSTGGRHTT